MSQLFNFPSVTLWRSVNERKLEPHLVSETCHA